MMRRGSFTSGSSPGSFHSFERVGKPLTSKLNIPAATENIHGKKELRPTEFRHLTENLFDREPPIVDKSIEDHLLRKRLRMLAYRSYR